MVDSEEAQTAAQTASVRTAAYGTDENTATKQQAKLQSKTAGIAPSLHRNSLLHVAFCNLTLLPSTAQVITRVLYYTQISPLSRGAA